MKLAAPYPLRESRRDLIDEYNIEFDLERHNIDNLLEWIRKPQAQEKRINLKIFSALSNEVTLSQKDLLLLNDLHPQLFIRVGMPQLSLIPKYQNWNLKFFLDSDYNINSFCQLQDVINLGVTDVYIYEDLCYHLPKVREYCTQHHIRIRIIVNRISSSTIGKHTDVTAPFYLPENLPVMSQYYDVIEFDLGGSWNRFDVLEKIWRQDGNWRGNARDINIDLELDISGTGFFYDICEEKMTCGHRCLSQGSSCRKCQQYMDIVNTMESKGYEFTLDRKWVENEILEPINFNY